ncbi:MAG TPA: ATPase, T2SS/T4P/T4SS family [Candidatus Acidoferrales bacterium]|nr:ATPase, T2SS/T4P/T4SS family [Candidatus Acidoferrales bacterium]
MNSENIKKVTNQAIEQLITALNEGRSETLTQYLAAIGRFHRYSLRNVMLIASQKPSATHVAGFNAWHKLGRFVKKGEKGIMILAPIVRRKNESAEQKDTDESSTAVGFRAAYVFDISQTDGEELPTIGSVNGEPREYSERLAKFVAEQGIALWYSDEIAPARGTSAGGKITLLPGQSPAEEFATLVHELAHEMMHRDERRNGTSKRSRETEAEAVAFVVCHAIGLETGSASRETTLLNALGKLISDDDRILLIEDTSEIQLEKPNFVRFEARQAQPDLPAITIRDLLKASLRHRPDRIILGEIRGGEAFDLLQLLNTGHSGTLSTVHASSAAQALARFTSCVLQSGIELPYRAIKSNIADSLNVLIQLERRPGKRFVAEVLEIRGYNSEADRYNLSPIFTTQ